MAGSVNCCGKELHTNPRVHLLSLLPPFPSLGSKLRTEAGPQVALTVSQVTVQELLAWELGVRYPCTLVLALTSAWCCSKNFTSLMFP